ncbi:hypothetical protein [Streptomyces sp. NPDC058086]|uniref:hypothetical protein n=1 Tax=Streptomyces sp. NPDC058086 TaxID=3346334 RepID=UPI0036EFF012
MDEQATRDLWRDYDDGWHSMAETFALSIDQWYHALGKGNQDSVYWRHRGTNPDLDIQERTFDVLINTAVTAHVLQAIVDEKPVEGMASPPISGEGPLSRAAERAGTTDLESEAVPVLAAGVVVRESVGLDVPGFKGFLPAAPFDEDIDEKTRDAIATYWSDPIEHANAVASPVAGPVPAFRFSKGAEPGDEIRGLAREGAYELMGLLGQGLTMQQLDHRLSFIQRHLLRRMIRAGMVTAADT